MDNVRSYLGTTTTPTTYLALPACNDNNPKVDIKSRLYLTTTFGQDKTGQFRMIDRSNPFYAMIYTQV